MPQYYQKQIALGSEIEISLVLDNPKKVRAIYTTLWKKIFQFEARFSRFLPQSELTIFNKNAGTKQYISKEFKQILIQAKKLSSRTDQIYNPFILPALQRIGYKNSLVKGHFDDYVEDFSNKAVVNINDLKIAEDWAMIPFGSALDLGGCGKGYIADLLANYLNKRVTNYWMSFGGDLVFRGKDSLNKNWSVNIASEKNDSKYIGTLKSSINKKEGVASSGINFRKGINNNQKWHHLIDPRTLLPAKTNILMSTVLDSSCLRADVFASCLVILGYPDCLDFIAKHKIKDYLIQYLNNDKIMIFKKGHKIKLINN